MKKNQRALRVAVVLFVGLIFVPLARAGSIYTFKVDLTIGTVTGTLTGTLDLSFVNPGGSGSGAASSLVFTSIPAGFGSLVGGNAATSWANQVTNLFTVISGTITSDEFFATTGLADPSDVLCLNSTSDSGGTVGGFTCPSHINELHVASGVFGFNASGLEGITFSLVSSATPEASSLILFGTSLLGLVPFRRKLFGR